jgi:signal peptidase I
MLDIFASNCALLVIALFCFGFVFQNFFIPSSSMAVTLLTGDHVAVDRTTLSPGCSWMHLLPYREVRRGDIVVFYKPTEEPDGDHRVLVKRVIGIPGDRIHMRAGVVYLNGVAQDEPYAAQPTLGNYDAYRDDFPSIAPSDAFGVYAEWALELPSDVQGGDLVVPPGRYFVMGDNRAKSQDGRYWGFVPRANMIGRPLVVYWSFPTPNGLFDGRWNSEQASFSLHELVHFFDETRWRRTLHPVK